MHGRCAMALQYCRAVHAPDDRTTCFDLSVRRGEEVTLHGTVETERLRDLAAAAVREAVDEPVVVDEATVLEAMAESNTVSAPVASARAAPGADAERVTEVLYGAPVEAYDADGRWRRVRTPDGYLAWLRESALVPSTGDRFDAVVTALELDPDPAGETRDADQVRKARTASRGDETRNSGPERLLAGTPCRILGRDDDDDRVRVAFATGAERRLPAATVRRRNEDATGRGVVDLATEFRGAEYEWGGMTADGIDCSGLVWIAYRCHGIRLPRDADQQREIGAEVDRDELEPGDLLFFPGHVGVSLGGSRFVHAYGSAEEVTIGSLDPDDERYESSLDDGFERATRPLRADE